MWFHASIIARPGVYASSRYILARQVPTAALIVLVMSACLEAMAEDLPRGEEVVAQAIEQAVPSTELTAAAMDEVPEPSERLDFRNTFQKGLRTFDVSVGTITQHDIPSGPRSNLDGDRLGVAWRRFDSPRVEKGLELSLSTLENGTHSTRAWELVYARRQYFHVRSDHALHWSIGAGLCHLTNLVPEQGSHTNFTEEVGVGYMHRAGRRTAWTADYRFAHISDGGRNDPNIGLNCSIVTVGWRLHY